MTGNGEGAKPFDLADRTRRFAKAVRELVRRLPRTLSNREDARQLVRSSGSVGANYLEACESVSEKDRALRMKICRKEAKESGYWLDLLDVRNDRNLEAARRSLEAEADELTRIFGAIVNRSSRS